MDLENEIHIRCLILSVSAQIYNYYWWLTPLQYVKVMDVTQERLRAGGGYEWC